ncbi:hypothetical protein Anapl_16481 [Anas platyrhynchos]|uniref:Uncharacterized protein n=1 Tax=Anas platyrhynchos TaxID=8839 RepID=R0JUC6_ANAPL|nr:hypothetical protein Anapl_16481 [Anas platyrhynchos]
MEQQLWIKRGYGDRRNMRRKFKFRVSVNTDIQRCCLDPEPQSAWGRSTPATIRAHLYAVCSVWDHLQGGNCVLCCSGSLGKVHCGPPRPFPLQIAPADVPKPKGGAEKGGPPARFRRAVCNVLLPEFGTKTVTVNRVKQSHEKERSKTARFRGQYTIYNDNSVKIGESKSLTQEENKGNNAVWSRNSVGTAGALLPGWIKFQPSGSKEDYAKGTVWLQRRPISTSKCTLKFLLQDDN